MLISCLPQCHLQVCPLHTKEQVGAIPRKIAKPGPGLHLCVHVIPRLFHGCAWFLSVQCTQERMTVQPLEGPIAWRLPPRGHGRDRGIKYPASRTLSADTLQLSNGKDVVTQPVKACIPSNLMHLEPSVVRVWLMMSTAPSQRVPSESGTCPQAGSSTFRTQEAHTRRYRRRVHTPHSFPHRLPAAPLCPGCQW